MALSKFVQFGLNKSLILRSSVNKSINLQSGNQRIIKECYNYNILSARVSLNYLIFSTLIPQGVHIISKINSNTAWNFAQLVTLTNQNLIVHFRLKSHTSTFDSQNHSLRNWN